MLGRSAGSRRWTPLQTQEIKKGLAGARPLPLRCLSQLFAYLSPMGWPGIYNICFSQSYGDKDSLLLDEGFSFLIVVRLIRDN